MYKKLLREDVTKLDVVKLHEEVNLYINQRFVIMTTAITVFSFVVGLVLSNRLEAVTTQPSYIQNVENDTQSVLLLMPSVLMFILGLLFLYCQAVFKQIHVISVYLVAAESSAWERHYNNFVRHKKGARLKSSAATVPILMFLGLGILTVALFFIALFAYEEQNWSEKFALSILLFYFLSLPSMMYLIKEVKDLPSILRKLLIPYLYIFLTAFLIVVYFHVPSQLYQNVTFQTRQYILDRVFNLSLFVIACWIYFWIIIKNWSERNLVDFREEVMKYWEDILKVESVEEFSSYYTMLSKPSLYTVWDNFEDDIYNKL